MYTLKEIRWHARLNPWFKYVLEALPQVKIWWKMTRAEITRELKARKMPQQWTSWNKMGQIHRLITHDFPDKDVETEDGGQHRVSATDFYGRYIEFLMADPEVWK